MQYTPAKIDHPPYTQEGRHQRQISRIATAIVSNLLAERHSKACLVKTVMHAPTMARSIIIADGIVGACMKLLAGTKRMAVANPVRWINQQLAETAGALGDIFSSAQSQVDAVAIKRSSVEFANSSQGLGRLLDRVFQFPSSAITDRPTMLPAPRRPKEDAGDIGGLFLTGTNVIHHARLGLSEQCCYVHNQQLSFQPVFAPTVASLRYAGPVCILVTRSLPH